MSEALQVDEVSREEIERLEGFVLRRLHGQVRDFRLQWQFEGLILSGRAHSYYAKQLAQQAVMEVSRLRILANEIAVH